MTAAHPVELRRRAVSLARAKEKSIAQLAADLGISESCLRRWMKTPDVDEGVQECMTSDERDDLVRLRRENRFRRRRSRSCGKRRCTSRGRWSVQKVLPGDRPSRRHRDRSGFGVPGAAGLEIELLRLGVARGHALASPATRTFWLHGRAERRGPVVPCPDARP